MSTAVDPPSLARFRDVAEATAVEAGRILLEGWQTRPASTTKKAANDLVTEFDRRSEALVTARLRDAFPDHALVGEEGANHGAPGGLTWYVDPLDGTMNYTHGLPLFAVSIGLVDHAAPGAPAPLVGVIHAPALGWTFSGAVGLGATRNGASIAVSQVDDVASALAATGFPHVPGEPLANVAEWTAFLAQSHGVRRLGTAAIDLAAVACGWFDGHWERNVGPWDLAGGAALVLAAGGHVTSADDTTFDPRTGSVLATNGRVHASMHALLRKARGG
jgi:myo-inositol-1(or 4)-monophosphatase